VAAEPSGPREGSRELQLRQGRTLALDSADGDQLIEIRGPSGGLELRIRLTAEGPVLEIETVHLSLRAAESVDIDCKDFNLSADRIGLKSEGEMTLSGKADVRVDADGEVHVQGEMIYLN
jgi:hypothetical protein